MPSKRRVLPWKSPPRSKSPCLKTPEEFPGKAFAEMGARWLNFNLKSNYPVERRKEFAKLCFKEAVGICNAASLLAKGGGRPLESKRLAEIASWLESQYVDTL